MSPQASEVQKSEVLAGRRRRERAVSAASLAERLVAPFEAWTVRGGSWQAERTLAPAANADVVSIKSPPFHLDPGAATFVLLSFHVAQPVRATLAIWSPLRAPAFRSVVVQGSVTLAVRAPARRGRYWIAFSVKPAGERRVEAISDLALSLRTIPKNPEVAGDRVDTMLPHWSAWQRAIHRLCRKSAYWNGVVSAFEMHLGSEEVLSLPRYMALCPTGQCNASCGFCSVTTNRTGIIKKQLPFDKLDRFLQPVSNTIKLYGLEGNGEPTLYDQFDELLVTLTRNGAPLYLITNGERLTAEQIALLLACPTDSINFSLNAATAETHRRVMKLKSFDSVVTNIRRLVRWRGDSALPHISVSFVVNADNIHEVQDFLRFAEWDLKVDRVLLRPLSEIANADGSIEDLRDLVPYESDIEDMLDSVEQYLRDVPRRAEIVLDPDSFRAFRPDPVGTLPPPRGLEDRLLAPRPYDWEARASDVQSDWFLNTLRIATKSTSSGPLYESAPIPTGGAAKQRFVCRTAVEQGVLDILVVTPEGETLAKGSLPAAPDARAQAVDLDVSLKGNRFVRLLLAAAGGPVRARIDFDRLRTSVLADRSVIRLPHAKRWQIDSPGVIIDWSGSKLAMKWGGAPSLYLLKSYGVVCLPGQRLSFPVQISVSQGRLIVGILSEDARSWVQSFSFGPGNHDTEIAFDTGTQTRFQVVLYSGSESPLDVTIDWRDNLDPPPRFRSREISVDNLRLPPPGRWHVEAAAARAHWPGRTISLQWDGGSGDYLVKSEKFPCVVVWDFAQRTKAKVRVKKGKLGIGFLGEKSQLFVEVFTLDEGEHDFRPRVVTYTESELRVVLFAQQSGGLDAEIDWLDSLAKEEEWGIEHTLAAAPRASAPLVRMGAVPGRAGEHKIIEIRPQAETGTLGEPRFPEPQALSGESRNYVHRTPTFFQRVADAYSRYGMVGLAYRAGAKFLPYPIRIVHRLMRVPTKVAMEKSVKEGFGAFLRWVLRSKFGEPKFYCQKPWTDLNNFTVDGRMDVCCITTGPSQERYSLGNVFEQDFQQIWNGERMREFRRTVNSDKKLPPCERCPMANNYKSPF